MKIKYYLSTACNELDVMLRLAPAVKKQWCCGECENYGINIENYTVETLYSTIYYSKYFIQFHIDKSTQYVAL